MCNFLVDIFSKAENLKQNCKDFFPLSFYKLQMLYNPFSTNLHYTMIGQLPSPHLA